MSINKIFKYKQILYGVILFIGGFILSLLVIMIVDKESIGNIYSISFILFLILFLVILIINNIYTKKILLNKPGNKNSNVDESECRRKLPATPVNNDKRSLLKDRRKNQIIYEFNDVNILIIDNNLIELHYLKEQLSVQGINIYTCTNGKEAIKKLSQSIPDLLLLDITLPHLNGFEIVKKIRKKHPREELPVIFLTEKNKIRDIETAFWAGANDYIIKPFSSKELLTRINFQISLKKNIIKNKKLFLLQNEINVAQKIHLHSIQENIPDLKNYNIFAKYQPMHEIGGDYYNFNILDENRIGIFISDVSGHGIPAALIAAMIKIIVITKKNTATEPANFLEEMNNTLIYNIADQFVTASYIFIDYDKKELLHARAGHEPLIIINKNNKKIKKYQPKGKAIGWYNHLNCKVEKIKIASGERIILYSDGIINVTNNSNKLFGLKNFTRNIADNTENSPETFIHNLFKALRNWAGSPDKLSDDITIVVIDIV